MWASHTFLVKTFWGSIPMHARGNDIVARAKEYDGVRWRHHGRSMDTGVDCAGLLICVGHDLGITEFDTLHYARRPNAREFKQAMLRAGCLPIHPNQIANGDILRIAESKHPVHVGIYEKDERGQEWIIHSWAVTRKVVREPLSETRRNQIVEVMRYPE